MTVDEFQRILQVKQAQAFKNLATMAKAGAVPKEWMHNYIMGEARVIERFIKDNENKLEGVK